MRTHRLFVVTFALLLLAGCTGQTVVAPSSSPSASAPVFASDEEALEAAVAAYEQYLAVSDQIAADGGANPERLKDLVTPEWYEKEVEVFEKIASAGMSQVGATTVGTVELQRAGLSSEMVEIVVYACTDFSATSWVNSEGHDVTPTARQLRSTFQLTFVGNGSRDLKLDGSEPWSGSSC